MLLPLCLSIIREFKGSGKERTVYAANLLLSQCITSSTISAGILTSTVSNPLAAEYIKNTSGAVIEFGKWMLWGFPPALIMTFLSWLIIQLLFRVKTHDDPSGKVYIVSELQKIGGITPPEIKAAAVIGVTVLLWVFGSKIGIDAASVALIGAVLMFMPGLRVLEWNDCKEHIDLSVIFLISGGISLGDAMASAGSSDWLAEKLFGFMPPDISLFATVAVVIVLIQFLHVFFMGTATMANAFFPILVSIASRAGVGAASIVIPAAFMIGGLPVLTFFNTTPNVLCYDTGYLKAEDFIKIGIPISVVGCAVYILFAYWYWPITGLLPVSY
jgi:anion transporter